jgi:hypothetical protein
MIEWVGFRSTGGCSGWSPRGRKSTNILHKNMKIIRSSSRSAAAIVLGLCVVSPGTKTCHSVVSLADRLGIIDYEQTRYLIPSEGTIYASKWMVTIGLLTRTVSDAVHSRVGESEVDRTPSWFLQVNEVSWSRLVNTVITNVIRASFFCAYIWKSNQGPGYAEGRVCEEVIS